jgi:hypothetical protein
MERATEGYAMKRQRARLATFIILAAFTVACGPGVEAVRVRVPAGHVDRWTRDTPFPWVLAVGARKRELRRVHAVHLVDRDGRRFAVPRPARVRLDAGTLTVTSIDDSSSLHLRLDRLDFAEIDARVTREPDPWVWVLGSVAVTALAAGLGFMYLFLTTAD